MRVEYKFDDDDVGKALFNYVKEKMAAPLPDNASECDLEFSEDDGCWTLSFEAKEKGK